MRADEEEFDLESMRKSLGEDTIELPDEIKVQWESITDHWSFTIKYISSYGVGFPRRDGGCKYCSFNTYSKCTMPDGTVFDINNWAYGKTLPEKIDTFVRKVIEWANKHAKPKLRLTDEVEFMDV